MNIPASEPTPSRRRDTAANEQSSVDVVASTLEQLQTLASVLELQSDLDAESTLAGAAELLVRRIASIVSADRVILAWRKQPQQAVRRIADTEAASTWKASAEGRIIDAACEEAIARGGTCHWPAINPADRLAARAIAQMATEVYAKSVVTVCLTDADGTSHGVLVVVNGSSTSADSFLRVTVPLVAAKLCSIDRQTPSSLSRIGYRNFSIDIRSRQSLEMDRRRNLFVRDGSTGTLSCRHRNRNATADAPVRRGRV